MFWSRVKIVPCRPAFELWKPGATSLAREGTAFKRSFRVWFIVIRVVFIECQRKKTKVIPATKVYIVVSPWKLKMTTSKLLEGGEKPQMTALPLFFGLVWLRGKYGYPGSVNHRAKLSKPKAISDYFLRLIENGSIVHREEKVITPHRPIMIKRDRNNYLVYAYKIYHNCLMSSNHFLFSFP